MEGVGEGDRRYDGGIGAGGKRRIKRGRRRERG